VRKIEKRRLSMGILSEYLWFQHGGFGVHWYCQKNLVL
jgi:hypothetical protein